jgi:DNA-binding sugar fermentation-stimulating protein
MKKTELKRNHKIKRKEKDLLQEKPSSSNGYVATHNLFIARNDVATFPDF